MKNILELQFVTLIVVIELFSYLGIIGTNSHYFSCGFLFINY